MFAKPFVPLERGSNKRERFPPFLAVGKALCAGDSRRNVVKTCDRTPEVGTTGTNPEAEPITTKMRQSAPSSCCPRARRVTHPRAGVASCGVKKNKKKKLTLSACR